MLIVTDFVLAFLIEESRNLRRSMKHITFSFKGCHCWELLCVTCLLSKLDVNGRRDRDFWRRAKNVLALA